MFQQNIMSQKEHFYFVANNVLMLETPKLSLISDKQGPRLITLNHPLSESRQLSIIFPPAIIHYLQLTDISPDARTDDAVTDSDLSAWGQSFRESLFDWSFGW